MPVLHTWKYLKKTSNGIKTIWMKNKPITRSLAIKTNCLDCIGGSTVDVKNCPKESYCPFWPFRPYQDKTKKEEEECDS